MAQYDDEYGNEPRTTGDHQSRRGGSALPWVLLVLVLGIAGAGGYFGYGMFQAANEQKAAALKASEEAGGKLRDLQGANKDLEEKVKGLEQEKGNLSAQVQAKDDELAKLKATYDSLNEQMKSEIEKGEIRLSQNGERLQVDMVDKILFDSGKAEVTDHGGEVLMKIGGVLAKVEGKAIQVSGHTDDSPIADKELMAKFPTNWELSAARAVNVTRFLAEKAKVPGKRLVAAGYGEFHPISTNSTHEGRARNRRIEILLTPEVETKAVQVADAKGGAKGSTVAAKGKAPPPPPKKKSGRK
ncbi:MAG TPA: OmpA family protein [Myxococcaceae bacterium]|nr:OmpA family protein [Myxococcaceae bacterium]